MMKKIRMMVFLLALIFSMGIVGPAQATSVTVGDPLWYEFGFNSATGFAYGCSGGGCLASSAGNSQDVGDPAWTFTGAAILTVVDAFIAVDQFNIYDLGVLIGSTSSPDGSNPGTSDPVTALADSSYSFGVFSLGAGSHSITIEHIAGVAGAAYFRVASVPEPATMFLLGLGLVGLAGLRRKVK